MTLSDSLISVQPVSTLNSPDEGMTSGSNSIEQSGHALRLACATLRNSAIAYICAQLGGQPKDWILENGEFTRPETNMPILLINILAKLDFDLPIDPYAEIRTIEAAHGLSMRGLPELVEGRYQFLHDLQLTRNGPCTYCATSKCKSQPARISERNRYQIGSRVYSYFARW